MPSRSNLFLSVWAGTLFLTPLWWVTGLSFMSYHAAAILMAALMLHQVSRSGSGIYLAPSLIGFSGITAIYVFSFVIHAGSYPELRSVASIYNLSSWLAGLALVLVLSNVFSVSDMEGMLKGFPVLAWIAGVTAAAMLILSCAGIQNLEFPTPLYGLAIRVFGNAPLVETTFFVHALTQDWFASLFRPRFNIFAPYPTAAGGVLGVLLIMVWTWGCIHKKTRSPLFLLLAASNFLALCMTLSRTAVLGFGLSLVLVIFAHRKRLFLGIFLVAAFFFLLGPWIEKALGWVFFLREGSSANRLDLYRYSLSQLEGIDWFLGLGLKPREEISNFPVGSHSTYLSLMFKTGVSGFSIFIATQIGLLWRWYRMNAAVAQDPRLFFFWRGTGWALCFMLFWMLTDDIDAPPFVAFLYFSIIGFFEGLRRDLKI